MTTVTKAISMLELKKHLEAKTGEEVLLDVRGPDEFHAGHVPGAINIPHTEITKHFDRLRGYKKIYIHCRSGGRASMAAEVLLQAGFTSLVCVTGSGMPDWEAAGFPVEK